MEKNKLSSFGKITSLVELLQYQALNHPEKRAYSFLAGGEVEDGYLTYGELDQRAKAVGAYLQSFGLQGERALLLYPNGLDYIVSFMGCLYAGVVAVPAYPPKMNRNLLRLQNIVKDAEVRAVLTITSVLSRIEKVVDQTPSLIGLKWLMTEDINKAFASRWRDTSATEGTLAFLQYTSGSVGAPKGVMVSHGNLLHNAQMMKNAFEQNEDFTIVEWLPMFHDMGLIGNILQTLYLGASCVLMTPADFLQKPYRWLKVISDYKGNFTCGPNFAYELCAQKITAEQKETLNLTSWKTAVNGAEPVRYETVEKFSEIFRPCGFRKETFNPCYGLAEATLFVSGKAASSPPIFKKVNGQALEKHVVVSADDNDENSRVLVSCGHSWLEQKIVIADPETLAPCSPNEIGEIWISGSSVAKGYWNKPELTETSFHAYLAESGEGPFYRTGDLGFMEDGEVFVGGRIKDLIIIRGTNHYPQDIELTVEQSHEAIQLGCCAAFSTDIDGEERLIIAAEVDRKYWRRGDKKQFESAFEEIYSAIKKAVLNNHELQLYKGLLLKPGMIPKTSSGKIQRHACINGFLDKTLIAEGVEI